MCLRDWYYEQADLQVIKRYLEQTTGYLQDVRDKG